MAAMPLRFICLLLLMFDWKGANAICSSSSSCEVVQEEEARRSAAALGTAYLQSAKHYGTVPSAAAAAAVNASVSLDEQVLSLDHLSGGLMSSLEHRRPEGRGTSKLQTSLAICLAVLVASLLVISCCILFSTVWFTSSDYDKVFGTEKRSHSSRGLSSQMPLVNRPLCPGLVVPRGAECLLTVPLLEARDGAPLTCMPLIVKDLSGKPVINCEVSKPDWSVIGRHTVATLQAAATSRRLPGKMADHLARCEAFVESDNLRRYGCVYDSKNSLYAQVERDPDKKCYTLRGVTCISMVFDGNFQEQAVNVRNEPSHEPLAQTVFDEGNQHVKIRVASGVDVIAVLCGILLINFLECP